MNVLTQAYAITTMNLRNLGERKTSSIVAIVGIAGVVAILIGILSMREGFRTTLELSGAKDVAIIMRGGARNEMSSGLTLENVRLIADAPKVLHNGDVALSSPELYVTVDAALRNAKTTASVPLRGVTEVAPKLRQHFKLVAGRMFTPGRFEIVVGRGAASQFAGLQIGKQVRWAATDWEVVGIFSDEGGVTESEVWTDDAVLQGVFKRGATYQSVRVKLTSADAIGSFKEALSTDPRLNVHVFTEREYYAEQSKTLSQVISTVGYTVAVLMGIGAVFAALNTMYSAVASRTREIATLRALGFGATPVIASVLAEAIALGVIGALLGSIIAYFGFNGIRTSTLNMASFSQITFAFSVTLSLLAQGLVYALLLALIGGTMPALRAAHMSIVAGLREL